MAEYYVSIVGWPIEADSPEEAARYFYGLLKTPGASDINPILDVTNAEVELDTGKPPFYGGGAPLIERWTFDTEKWWEEFTNV